MSDDPSRLTVAAFLDAVAARSPSPSAGTVAAVNVASAAALAAMAARFADEGLHELIERAEDLRVEAIRLAEADARAYAAVLAAIRLPKDQPGREAQISAALQSATDVPVEIGKTASEVALVAARLAVDGNHRLVGEAQAAATLAEGAARATAAIVRLNVDLGDLPGGRVEVAASCVQVAHEAAEKALRETR